MRTPTLLLLVALVVGLGGHGCGGSAGGSRRGRLVIWTSHGNDEFAVFEKLCREFEETFRHEQGREVELVLSRVPHEGLDTKLKSAALSRTTPDLCRVDVAHVAALAWGSAAVRLDTLAGSPFADRDRLEAHFVPAALESNLVRVPQGDGRFETGLYGIPEQTNCLVLFRNRALFREHARELRRLGLDPERAPRTWDELRRYAAALSRPDGSLHGFGMDNTLWWSLPFLYGAGGRELLADPRRGFRVGFTEPEAVVAYEYWAGLAARPEELPGRTVRVEGGMWRAGANKDRAFLEGRLAMVLSGPWNIPTYTRRIPEVAASLVPAGPAGTASTVGGNNLVLMPTCVDRELALAFLEFVATDDYQSRWSAALDQIPTTRAALRSRAGEANALLRVFMEQMETARSRATIPNSEPLEVVFQRQMVFALEGKRPPREALERVAAAAEREVLAPIREAARVQPGD